MFQRKLKAGYFALEWLNIYATAYYGNYIFFLMRVEHGFSNRENLAMAALGASVYAVASWLAGKFAQRRGYFVALRIGFSSMAVILAAGLLANTPLAHYAVILCWNIAMCFTWPVLEALVSEGEDRKGLAAMIGIYNVVWASGAAVAYFSGGALLETLGHKSLFWLPAALHAAQLAIALGLQSMAEHGASTVLRSDGAVPGAGGTAYPSTPIDPHDIHVPLERKKAFLRLAWIANPFAYIAMNTVIPLIPDVAARLHLTTTLAGFVCSVWMFARLIAFFCLWRWPGWHYRFGWLVGAFVAMIGCFAALLLVENLAVVVIAQFIFGLAVGLIYYSSLFYAMDVGETKGEHGGAHEALIGVGLFAGPAIGTAALYAFPAIPRAGILTVGVVLSVGLLIVLRTGRGSGQPLARKSLS
ncbi:MAG: hypothetical protein L0Y58_02455 [Verrucomicrobia subdivision 3 bacterium]|nr:hypothetical protein [Limisphaerales bacterium]